jgi:hypothetical protein
VYDSGRHVEEAELLRSVHPLCAGGAVVRLGLFALILGGPAVGPAAASCMDGPTAGLAACLAADGWEQVQDEDGIRVYTRDHPRSNIREVMARTLIRSDPQALFQLLTDVDRYTEFMPSTLERCELLAEHDGSYFVFQQLDLPFVDDRYYTIRLSPGTDAGGEALRLSWELAKDSRYAVEGRGSRVRVNRGFWSLRPTGRPGETEAIYFVHTDPGKIWSFVANMANRMSVPDVLRSVRERAEGRPPDGAATGRQP